MKKIQNLKTDRVHIDAKLNEHNDKNPFPEKLEKANAILSKTKLPDKVIKSTQG